MDAYPYIDEIRWDVLRMIPADGEIIGSIGCGYGTTEQELVRQGKLVHGVDIAPESVAVAEKRLTSARLVKPGDKNVFQLSSLDGLILADVIEHIPQAWEALKEFSQYVKPGGWIVISVPNMRQVVVVKEFFLRGDWPEKDTGIFDQTHLQVMSRKRLERWCENAGLVIDNWFDAYDPRGPRRQRLMRYMDLASPKLFHGWFMYQLQIRCRVSTRK